jgi:hypothetical protein
VSRSRAESTHAPTHASTHASSAGADTHPRLHARTRVAALGVGRHELGWLSRAGHASVRLPPSTRLTGPEWAQALAELWAQFDRPPQGELHVTVADAWVRYWVTTPPPGLRSVAELQAVARARFDVLYRDTDQAWAIEADWSATHPFICAAMPTALQEALRNSTGAHGLRLASLVPQSLRAFHALPLRQLEDGWVCHFRDDGLTTLRVQGGHAVEMRQYGNEAPTGTASPATVSANDVLARLRSQALAAGVEMPRRLMTAGHAPDFRNALNWDVQRGPVLPSQTSAALSLAETGLPR